MDRRFLPPFDLSRILLVGGRRLVLSSLPGPPVVRELMQVVTTVPGQGGRFQVSGSPNIYTSPDMSVIVILGQRTTQKAALKQYRASRDSKPAAGWVAR